jgi:RHS repeat-associated protein
MNLHMGILGIAVVPLAANVPVEAASGNRVMTTVYVGRHFEVRDHDQPVKYAFNGDTRVAHITGSLSSSLRLQRLRLQSGWNLISLAVTATNLAGQLNQFANGPAPLVQAVFRWQPATRDYAEVIIGQTVEAGSVLWLKARTNALVAVTGIYVEPSAPSLAAGGGYIPSLGLEYWSPALPTGVTTWKYDSQYGTWWAGLSGDLTSVSDPPPTLAPGDAIYVHTSEAAELEIPEPARRVLYYHPDHLGSSTVITDAAGHLAEETAFYPFGASRHVERPGEIEAHYGFIQKEQDPESGLQSIGHRYLHPVLGRWLSTDPLLEKGGSANPYAYVKQSPLKHYDSDGLEITVGKHTKAGITTYDIRMQAVMINTSSTKFTQQEMADYAKKVEASIERAFTGKEGNSRWQAKVNLRVINDYSEIGECDHVFRIMDKLRKGSSDGAGATVGGTKVIDIAANIIRKPTPDQVDRSNPANKHYTWENYVSPESTAAHETGHSAGLPHVHGKANLMQSGTERGHDTHAITLEQIKIMYKAASSGKLNQRDKELDAIAPRR